MVARVLGPRRGCGLITLMVSVEGRCPAAQEMGHLSLFELMAACGRFSLLLSWLGWERAEGREEEGR